MVVFRKATKCPVRYWQCLNPDSLTHSYAPPAPLETQLAKLFPKTSKKFSFPENNKVQ